MSEQDNQAALQEFMQSTVPLSQVRESMNLENGQYDLACIKLEPLTDDEGKLYFQGEFKVIAGPGCSPKIVSLANAQFGNTHRERFYIGTKDDLFAKLPETRLNSMGFGKLKGIGRACQVPTNDQPVATLVNNLLGKSFSVRVDTTKSKKDGKEYCNLGRNPLPIGVTPARLDSEAAGASATTAPAPTGNGAATQAPAGSFVTE